MIIIDVFKFFDVFPVFDNGFIFKDIIYMINND